MGQQLRTWHSEGDDRLWLSMLIDAIEEVSRPELRAVPCDPLVLAAAYAQLARRSAPTYGSAYSLRN